MNINLNKNAISTIVIGSVIIGAMILIFLLAGNTTDEPSAPTTNTQNQEKVRDSAFVSISSQDFQEVIDKEETVLLDVRTPQEYNTGHINGAKNIDFYEADFQDQLAQLDKDKQYAVYCRSGNRSSQTLELMKELGFENVVELQGGIISYDNQNNCTGVC